MKINSQAKENFIPKFFQKLCYHAHRYYEMIEIRPEKIQFRDYLANPRRYREEVATHWQRHCVWITKELEGKGWIWGVVCGSKIVDGSADLFDFPTEEELCELGNRKNLIPFAYSLADEPEATNL